MGKSKLTKEIEAWVLLLATKGNNSELICQEVSVSKFMNGGKHKFVDVMRYNRYKNEFTCYEIKVTKEDLNSKNGHNFVGDKNYYVVPSSLKKEAKEKVKGTDIGVMTYNGNGSFGFPVHPTKRHNTRKTKYFMLLTLSKAINREKEKLVKENEKLKRELEEINEQMYKA